MSIPTRFSLNSLSFSGRFRWNPVGTGDPPRKTDIPPWFGHIRSNLYQSSLVSWRIGLLAGWTALRIDRVVGSVRGEGYSTQRESRVKGRYLSCSRFRWGTVQFSLREDSDIAGDLIGFFDASYDNRTRVLVRIGVITFTL